MSSGPHKETLSVLVPPLRKTRTVTRKSSLETGGVVGHDDPDPSKRRVYRGEGLLAKGDLPTR